MSMSKKRALKAELELHKAIIDELQRRLELKEKLNKVFVGKNADLSKAIDSKNILLDHFEQTIRSCESACIYLQERADKAEQIIGRMMVDGELD